jgi:uncharacterized membrane protein
VKYSVVILEISALVALAAAPNFGPALAITIMTIVSALVGAPVAYFWKRRA